jgi:hypothetical protein
MAEGEKDTKKSAAESFSEMVGEFGSALGEIFRDPKLREKAQEFARSTGEAVQAFVDRFKEEEVKQRFKQAGRAAEDFGQKVAKHFEVSEKDSSPRSDFEMGIDKAVRWGRRVAARKGEHFRSTRVQRLISYNLAIVWSFLLLIFFNFFHQYVAYYHYEVVGGVGQWMREPLLTAEFGAVLPVLNVALILSILGNGVLIVFDRYLLRQGISIILHVFGLAVILSFLTVFPFNFDVVPFPNASRVLSIIVAIVFIAIAIGLVVGIVVRIVRIVIASIRAEI